MQKIGVIYGVKRYCAPKTKAPLLFFFTKYNGGIDIFHQMCYISFIKQNITNKPIGFGSSDKVIVSSRFRSVLYEFLHFEDYICCAVISGT